MLIFYFEEHFFLIVTLVSFKTVRKNTNKMNLK